MILATPPADSVLDAPSCELSLRICGTSRDGQVVKLVSSKCSIGSDRSCTLRLRARAVRPLHCLILRSQHGMAIRSWSPDTLLNGRRFQDAPLLPGDRLTCGTVQLEVLPNEHDGEYQQPIAVARPWPAENLAARTAELCSRSEQLDKQSRQLEATRAELQSARADLDVQRQQLEAQQASLAIESESLQASRADVDALRTGLEQRQAELEAQQAELRASRAGLKRQVVTFDALHRQWEAERDRLAAEFDERQARLDAAFSELATNRKTTDQQQAVAEKCLVPTVEPTDDRASSAELERCEPEPEPQQVDDMVKAETLEGEISEAASTVVRDPVAERNEFSQHDEQESVAAGTVSGSNEDALFERLRKLSGLSAGPGDTDSEQGIAATEATAESAVPPPDDRSAPSEPAEPISESQAPAPAHGRRADDRLDAPPVVADEEEESIESYMVRLLNRARGESTAPSTMAQARKKTVPSENPPPAPLVEPAASSIIETPPHPTKQAPPAPRSAPPEVADLAAMRELANLQARAAINTHAKSVSLRVPVARWAMATAALAGGAATIVIAPEARLATTLGAVASLVLSGFWAYLAVGATKKYRRARQVRKATVVRQPQDAA